MAQDQEGGGKRERRQEFVTIPDKLRKWLVAESKRREVSRSKLIATALREYADGNRSAQLTQGEIEWLVLYRQYVGKVGDEVTLRALTVIASRAFASASVAAEVRSLASRLVLPDVRPERPKSRKDDAPRDGRGPRPVSEHRPKPPILD